MVNHEGQAQEEGQHCLAAPAHQSHEGALDHPAKAPHGKAGTLHADSNHNVP
jgi:hypothetical protein